MSLSETFTPRTVIAVVALLVIGGLVWSNSISASQGVQLILGLLVAAGVYKGSKRVYAKIGNGDQ